MMQLQRPGGMGIYALVICFVTSMMHAHADRFDFVSVDYLLKKYPDITYQKCHDAIKFDCDPFPLSQRPEQQPHSGTFSETFALTIPDGKVCSIGGTVLIDGRYVLRDLMTRCYTFQQSVADTDNVIPIDSSVVRKVPGRVAVITGKFSFCYGHWFPDTLCRLAILEMMGIEYDWLYVPHNQSFMKETLQLWGIDPSKIIEPSGEFYYIQADELIVPSLANRRVPTKGEFFCDHNQLINHYPVTYIEYIKDKFLSLVQQVNNTQVSCKKIFISRKDGAVWRQVVNEDEIFAIFEPYGFKRYEIGRLSFLEQVNLFNQAEKIVSFHGSGLTNIMFCNPSVHIIEIFQARPASCFCFLAYALGLQYSCVKTTDFDPYNHYSTVVPLSVIQDFVNTLDWK